MVELRKCASVLSKIVSCGRGLVFRAVKGDVMVVWAVLDAFTLWALVHLYSSVELHSTASLRRVFSWVNVRWCPSIDPTPAFLAAS